MITKCVLIAFTDTGLGGGGARGDCVNGYRFSLISFPSELILRITRRSATNREVYSSGQVRSDLCK
jgi:hypothetical protein